jgi:hypothetical protein
MENVQAKSLPVKTDCSDETLKLNLKAFKQCDIERLPV